MNPFTFLGVSVYVIGFLMAFIFMLDIAWPRNVRTIISSFLLALVWPFMLISSIYLMPLDLSNDKEEGV